ncbi:MAG: hypothetical protein JW818_10360 [Pirellulales bacterium]|nr:hypothetical protein [Pirellulales bacterium]
MSTTREKKAVVFMVVRILALPSAALGVSFFTFLAENVAPPFGALRVIEKCASETQCSIVAKSEPNENGGTITYATAYPKWFYAKVAVGDWLVIGFCHFRLVRDGQWIATYIPWHVFPGGFVPLTWCLPMILWLPRPKVLHSWFFIGLAAASELSLVGVVLWAKLHPFWK